MTCTELYQLMANPALLSTKTLPDLRQIVNDFPYFHAARMLYLKNLAMTEDIRMPMEMKKMAVHVPDRMKLYQLIEQKQPIPPVDHQTGQFDLDSTYTTSVDYTQFLMNENQRSEESTPKLQHQELIDSFIQNEKSRSQSRKTIKSIDSDNDSDYLMKGPDNQEKSLDNMYFTETLAYIYIKQKRYDKALEIIKNLSLKYPKKNIYFADQIRYLEKLIIHTKK